MLQRAPLPAPVAKPSRVQRPAAFRSASRTPRHRLAGALALLLTVQLAAAQTAQAQPAPAQPTPAQPAPAQTAPARPAAAPANPAPAGGQALNVSSALAVEVSGAVKGRLVPCPPALKLAASAVCLYTKNTLPAVRSVLRGKLSGRVASDWKSGTGDKTASILVRSAQQNAYVLLAQLSSSETLVVVDSVAAAGAAPRAVAPAGVVKGERYVLDSDLRGLVNVASLGNGTYRLASVAGGPVLSISAGKRSATLGGGVVELPLAPISDGKNLLFPLDGLRALACTVTPAQVGVTVACGSASASIRPIVF